MPVWFFYALIGPFTWSIASFMDKYLLQKYFRNQGGGALMIFTGVFGAFPALLILLFNRHLGDIGVMNALASMSAGFIYIFGFLPYLYALQSADASVVTPMFQLMPVFLYTLSRVFLHETLTPMQMGAGVLVMAGAFVITLERRAGSFRVRGRTIGFMLIACLLIASTEVIFKAIALQASYWVTAFWQYLGGLVGAGVLLLVRSYRTDFLNVFRANATRVLWLNFLNDGINMIGGLTFAYATLLGPIALVSVVNGLQPFIMLLIGLIITRFFIHLGKESIDHQTIVQKAIAGVLMFIGIYFLNVVS